jgi:hypothetical protein
LFEPKTLLTCQVSPEISGVCPTDPVSNGKPVAKPALTQNRPGGPQTQQSAQAGLQSFGHLGVALNGGAFTYSPVVRSRADLFHPVSTLA